MRALVNLLFLAGYLVAFGGAGYWAHQRFIVGAELIEAAAKGDLDAARSAIEHGASVDGDGLEGYNAMRSAIKNGHIDMVRLLIEKGADPSRRTMDYTPLGWAAAYGKRPIFDYLRGQGARLNLTDYAHKQLTSHIKNWGSRDMLPEVEALFQVEGVYKGRSRDADK